MATIDPLGSDFESVSLESETASLAAASSTSQDEAVQRIYEQLTHQHLDGSKKETRVEVFYAERRGEIGRLRGNNAISLLGLIGRVVLLWLQVHCSWICIDPELKFAHALDHTDKTRAKTYAKQLQKLIEGELQLPADRPSDAEIPLPDYLPSKYHEACQKKRKAALAQVDTAMKTLSPLIEEVLQPELLAALLNADEEVELENLLAPFREVLNQIAERAFTLITADQPPVEGLEAQQESIMAATKDQLLKKMKSLLNDQAAICLSEISNNLPSTVSSYYQEERDLVQRDFRENHPTLLWASENDLQAAGEELARRDQALHELQAATNALITRVEENTQNVVNEATQDIAAIREEYDVRDLEEEDLIEDIPGAQTPEQSVQNESEERLQLCEQQCEEAAERFHQLQNARKEHWMTLQREAINFGFVINPEDLSLIDYFSDATTLTQILRETGFPDEDVEPMLEEGIENLNQLRSAIQERLERAATRAQDFLEQITEGNHT